MITYPRLSYAPWCFARILRVELNLNCKQSAKGLLFEGNKHFKNNWENKEDYSIHPSIIKH